jgi:hypothetical protein
MDEKPSVAVKTGGGLLRIIVISWNGLQRRRDEGEGEGEGFMGASRCWTGDA